MVKILRIQITLAILFSAIALLLIYLVAAQLGTDSPSDTVGTDIRLVAEQPDFKSFQNVQDKKQAFFDYLLPMIRRSNDSVLQQREQLEAMAESSDSPGQSETRLIDKLAIEYDIDDATLSTQQKLDLLLRRIDMVPASLALAQAAKESGWGTSRFAIEANNYFGQWCYTRGCGLVPARRAANASHEVKTFLSVAAAVDSYIKNLNTHPAYSDLRGIRAQLREEGEITGIGLAAGLSNYSERGEVYIGEIQSLINYNHLSELDRSLSE